MEDEDLCDSRGNTHALSVYLMTKACDRSATPDESNESNAMQARVDPRHAFMKCELAKPQACGHRASAQCFKSYTSDNSCDFTVHAVYYSVMIPP